MFSALIPILKTSSMSLQELLYTLSSANLRHRLLIHIDPFLTFIRRKFSDFPVSFDFSILFISSYGVFIAMPLFASIMWSIYLEKKRMRKINGSFTAQLVISNQTGESMESDTEVTKSSFLIDDENDKEIARASHAMYAEDLQIQEALVASLLSSEMQNSASSSIMNPNLLEIISKKFNEQTETVCEICMEIKLTWQMFDNPTCSHSFCYSCISKHVVSKIQDNHKTVKCPGFNCTNVVDFDVCRSIIPNEVLIKWDEFLCKSLILESEKFYCPFNDCSVLLVNDSNEVIMEIKCPICKRSICATCQVPWHPEFSCEEFKKMNAKEKGREELMVEKLAKKKHWMKCPRCKVYVEKNEGCLHITCRCHYEFCYKCGSEWSTIHGNCKEYSQM